MVMIIEQNAIDRIIRPDELLKEITETQDHPAVHITIINVLSQKYFADCRIKNSINIQAHEIAKYVEDWDRSIFIVLYGASDDLTDCTIAYQSLIDMGFIYVRILLGGMA